MTSRFLLFGGADGCFTSFTFPKKPFFLFFTFSLRIWSRGGVRTSWIFGKFKFRKKNTSTKCFAFFLVTTLWLQGDSRAKWTYRFFKKSWPLFWRSHSFLRKSTYLFTDIFKDNLDFVEDNRKKSQFSHLEIIISVFFISITIRCTTA